MANALTRWVSTRRRSLDRLVDRQLRHLAPLLDTALERHGPEIAHVLHRLTRASLEVIIVRLVTRLARRHPATAATITMIGIEALDEFAQAHAQQLADWLVQRFITIGEVIADDDGDSSILPDAA